jgi:hypothetical protein
VTTFVLVEVSMMVLVWVVSTIGVVVAGTLTVGVYWFC